MNTPTTAAPAPAANRAALQLNSGNLAEAELPLILNKRQLAAALSCSSKHVENLTARGLLRAVRLGRCVRYRRDSVMRALADLEDARHV